MVALLRYAKDLKPGDTFLYKGLSLTVLEVQESLERCSSCGCHTMPKVRISVGGAILTFSPKEAVEMVESAVDSCDARSSGLVPGTKRERLSASIAHGE